MTNTAFYIREAYISRPIHACIAEMITLRLYTIRYIGYGKCMQCKEDERLTLLSSKRQWA